MKFAPNIGGTMHRKAAVATADRGGREVGWRYEYRNVEATSANVFVAIGGAFAVVGLTDLTLLWTPMRLAVAGWEFATISRTFTNLPITAVGLVLTAYGLGNHPSRHPGWMRAAAVVFGMGAVMLAMLGFLYLLAAPAVWREAGPEAREALTRALIKNGAEIVIYPTIFALVSVMLWRGVVRTGR